MSMEDNVNDKKVEEVREAELVMEEEGAVLGDDGDQSINELIGEQNREAEDFAAEFLKTVLALRGVRIDRGKFLTSELHKRGISREVIDEAVGDSPAAAGIDLATLDEIVESAISFETRKSTAMSFAAGLPGGIGMLATVPADITQFYVHSFRIMQKIAYVYGWQSFMHDTKEIDDETLGKLAGFLGVMMGVGGAASTVRAFAAQIARPALQKQIANKALTKTAWYPTMKTTLRMIGVKLTKDSLAKTVTKAVPVAGGFISGGMTFVALSAQSKRLMHHLRELPPPNVDAAQYLAALKTVEEEQNSKPNSVLSTAGGAIVGATESMTLGARSALGDAGTTVKDAAGDAGSAVEGLASGAGSMVKGAANGASGRLKSLVRRKDRSPLEEKDGDINTDDGTKGPEQ